MLRVQEQPSSSRQTQGKGELKNSLSLESNLPHRYNSCNHFFFLFSFFNFIQTCCCRIKLHIAFESSHTNNFFFINHFSYLDNVYLLILSCSVKNVFLILTIIIIYIVVQFISICKQTTSQK